MSELKKILIVDDDAPIRTYISRILSGDEFSVAEAEDGTACLEYLQDNRADLVIMDMIMPNQEGLETIMSIRKQYPGIKLIAISGGYGADFLEIAGKLGATAALKKPFDRQTLLTAVNNCF